MAVGRQVISDFALTDAEYAAIEPQWDNLVHFAAWQHLRSNAGNRHTDDEADLAQSLRLSLLTAGAYYKRQSWVEAAFAALEGRCSGADLDDLNSRWANRKRRAKTQPFGDEQERQLEDLVLRYVPPDKRPDKTASLVADECFARYAKAIIWNTLKANG